VADTKQRIKDVARELFARQGYTGTSMADIAGRLSITPAALYYHYRSKADVLDALLAEPLAAYAELAEHAPELAPAELLAAFVDFTAGAHTVIPVVTADPAVRQLLDERFPRTPPEMMASVITALAGPEPDRAALIRASAAFAVAKEATAAVLVNRSLESDDREEILAAALRALDA
jgi:AcrR family transcriptional regulator